MKKSENYTVRGITAKEINNDLVNIENILEFNVEGENEDIEQEQTEKQIVEYDKFNIITIEPKSFLKKFLAENKKHYSLERSSNMFNDRLLELNYFSYFMLSELNDLLFNKTEIDSDRLYFDMRDVITILDNKSRSKDDSLKLKSFKNDVCNSNGITQCLIIIYFCMFLRLTNKNTKYIAYDFRRFINKCTNCLNNCKNPEISSINPNGNYFQINQSENYCTVHSQAMGVLMYYCYYKYYSGGMYQIENEYYHKSMSTLKDYCSLYVEHNICLFSETPKKDPLTIELLELIYILTNCNDIREFIKKIR